MSLEPPSTSSTGRVSSKRPSIAGGTSGKDRESSTSDKDKLNGGERRLSVAGLKRRSELDLYLMIEVPKLFGVGGGNGGDSNVDSSDEAAASLVPKDLQEEAQGEFLNQVLFASDLSSTDLDSKIETKFESAKDEPGYQDFKKAFIEKINECRGTFAEARKQSKEVTLESTEM